MRLIQRPGADFPLGQRLPQRGTAELFGETIKMPMSPRRTRSSTSALSGIDKQAVERRTGRDATRLQSRHLIRHKCRAVR